MRISEEIFRNLIESYRRIRNTARFLLANLAGFNPAEDMLPHDELAPVDQYILLKLERLRSRVTAGFDDYEFHQPMTLIHQFCDNELSSFYIDVSKDKLYADAEHAKSRRSIRTVMWQVLETITQMMSPVLSPFVHCGRDLAEDARDGPDACEERPARRLARAAR